MAVGKNITLYAGDTYELRFYLKSAGVGVNLTGCTPQAQIRASAVSATILAEFDADLMTPQTGATAGGVILRLEPIVTKTLVNSVYDFQLTWPDGVITTYFGGTITVTPEVTRA